MADIKFTSQSTKVGGYIKLQIMNYLVFFAKL